MIEDELLAEGLAQLLRPGPADEIGGAARRIGQDELHGPVGPALSLGRQAGRIAGRDGRAGPFQEIATTHFKVLPYRRRAPSEARSSPL